MKRKLVGAVCGALLAIQGFAAAMAEVQELKIPKGAGGIGFLPLLVMERQKSGAIINVASTSGIRFTGAFQVGYAATKAGVIQLSRVVAVQYAAKGIRVNTVVPGQLHTPMVEARLARQRAGGDVAALLAERLARIPAGFMGDGRDTANAALFLASDEARFVTGTEIVVDGGMTVRCD